MNNGQIKKQISKQEINNARLLARELIEECGALEMLNVAIIILESAKRMGIGYEVEVEGA